jgi:hypothetical protein
LPVLIRQAGCVAAGIDAPMGLVCGWIIEAAILNLMLYTIWIGLPVVTAIVFCALKIRGEQESDTFAQRKRMKMVAEFFPVIMIGSTASILFDVFVVPSQEFRRVVFAVPWLGETCRVLIFPLSLFVGRSVALAVAFIRPAQVDSRFQNDLRGISPMFAVLGFVAALYFLYGRQEEEVAVSSSWDLTAVSGDSGMRDGGLRDKIESVLGGAVPSEPERPQIYSGANYEEYVELIEEYADAEGIEREVLLAIVAEESNFNPDYRGPDGGVGLLNVTASMARQVGVPDYLSPAGNLKAGTLVLRSLRELFGAENPRLWIAAYHFGTKQFQDAPSLVDEDPDVKAYVDAVMRKVEASR